ncbi:MAG: CvpA family protein [Ancalomicrobiaceae bacterium]|nr:CvpA family protein [Ancalomicrobiaceae bacterium]
MDFITLLDGIVLAVILISAILAMYRGFIREIFSIASWAAAAAAAYFLYKPILPVAKQYINNDYVALGVTVGVIFLAVLIVVSYITMKISDFVLDSSFGALDRSAGFLFGAARGLLLLVVAMMFFNWFVPEGQQPKWVSASKSKPVLKYLGDKLEAALPPDLAETVLAKIRKKGPDNSVPQEPDHEQSVQQPQPRTEAEPAYRTSQQKSLDQLITGSARTP